MGKRAKTTDAAPTGALDGVPDLEVVVSGDTVRVHSVLLTLGSPVFKAMLETDMVERAARKIELIGKDKGEFLAFVDAMHVSTMHVTKDNCTFLSRWADEYQCESLKKICEQHMLRHIPVTMDSFKADFEHATRFNLQRRARQCLDAACDSGNFVAFMDHSDNYAVLDGAGIHYLWGYMCDLAGFAAASRPETPSSEAGFTFYWPILKKAMNLWREVEYLDHVTKSQPPQYYSTRRPLRVAGIR